MVVSDTRKNKQMSLRMDYDYILYVRVLASKDKRREE